MTELRSIEDGEITRDLLNTMWESWPDHETSRFLDLRMRKLESQGRKNFIEAGLICCEMSTRNLWRNAFDPETGECFSSMDDWLSNCAPVSRSSCYEAMRVLKGLPDLSVDSMKEIPRTNLRTLVGLSSKVRRSPEVLEAASKQTESGFKKTIQQEFPEQHVEQNYRIAFNASSSLAKLAEEILRLIMRRESIGTREEALEFILTDWVNDHDLWKEME